MRLIHRMAVSDKNLPLLSYLHRHGCDINAHSFNSKDTPLLIAIQLEQFETVKFLVENGADVNMGTGLPVYHVSPLRTALERGNHEIVKFLLGAEGINLNVCTKAYKESVLESSLNDYPDFIEMLVEAGCDPNCADRYGRTPLTVMANGRNRDMVKFLIQHGADVNKKDFSYCNTVPLLESVRLGRLILVNFVLKLIGTLDNSDLNLIRTLDSWDFNLIQTLANWDQILKEKHQSIWALFLWGPK